MVEKVEDDEILVQSSSRSCSQKNPGKHERVGEFAIKENDGAHVPKSDVPQPNRPGGTTWREWTVE